MDQPPAEPARPALSPRLAALLDEVRRGQPLWDLGCDHGHLALRALAEGRVPRAVLVDRAPAAIARVSALLERHDPGGELASRARLVCADAARLPDEEVAGTVVVAGLGGRAIWRVLEGFVLKNAAPAVRLVLQPEVEAAWLVEQLGREGWRCRELEVVERSRRHAVVVAAREDAGAGVAQGAAADRAPTDAT